MRRSGGSSSSGGGNRRSGGGGVGAALGSFLQNISDNKITLLVSAGVISACVATYFFLNNSSNNSNSNMAESPSHSTDFSFNPPRSQQGNNNSTSSGPSTVSTKAVPIANSSASAISSTLNARSQGGATSAATINPSVSPSVAAMAKEVGGLLMGDGSVKAPESKPTTADAWYLLGTALLIAIDLSPHMDMEEKLALIKEGGKRVMIEGKYFNALECFQEGLTINAESEKCWLGASRVMFALDKTTLQNDTESMSAFTIKDKGVYNGLSCSKEALRLNPASSEAWCLLGWQITSKTGLVQIGDKSVSRLLAFVTAIELNPKDTLAWLYLGTVLGDAAKTIPLQKLGIEVNSIKCYIKAIEADKTNHRAWYALGLCVDSDHPTMVAGQVVTDLECFVNVLTLNPGNPEAWYNLGTILPAGGSAKILETEVDEIGCFKAALELNPNNGDAWYSLGVCLGPDHGIPFGEDNMFVRRDCYIAAIAVDETLYRAWYNLGLEADDGEVITLADGTEVDALACCAKSVEHNPSFVKGWYMLAKHVKEGGSVMVGGRHVSHQECKLTAARLGMPFTEQQ